MNSKKEPESTTTNSNKNQRNEVPLKDYPDDIPFSASLKRKTENEETGHWKLSSSNN